MDLSDLEKLHGAVVWLQRQESFSRIVERLRLKLNESQEPFVWSTVDLGTINVSLPGAIKSGWIFLLKHDVPSGCHYHPNSIQHMIALNGYGRSKVGSVERTIITFKSVRHSIEEKWYVIGQGVPHEFFPEGEDMAVVSFHTCEVSELEEIACGSGVSRLYETSSAHQG